SATVLSAISAPLPPPWRSLPRSFTTTLAPSRAKSRACSRPMPPPDPVTIATFPSSRPIADLRVGGALLAHHSCPGGAGAQDDALRQAERCRTGRGVLRAAP